MEIDCVRYAGQGMCASNDCNFSCGLYVPNEVVRVLSFFFEFTIQTILINFCVQKKEFAIQLMNRKEKEM